MQTNSPTLNIMLAAALKASKGLIRDFGELERLQVSKKGLGDFVSSADHRSEKIIIDELQKTKPEYSILAEESGLIKRDSPYTWVIDPLDGTNNFLHGIPHFALSIALLKNNEILAGITYDPIKDEMFMAERGRGAYLNQRRIRVSGRHYLRDCVLATGFPHGSHGDPVKFLNMLTPLMPKSTGLRRFGAATLDLAYVAAGRFDAYFELQCCKWDIAAGILLVQEAGGYVRSMSKIDDPLESGDIIASNPYILEDLQSSIVLSS